MQSSCMRSNCASRLTTKFTIVIHASAESSLKLLVANYTVTPSDRFCWVMWLKCRLQLTIYIKTVTRKVYWTAIKSTLITLKINWCPVLFNYKTIAQHNSQIELHMEAPLWNIQIANPIIPGLKPANPGIPGLIKTLQDWLNSLILSGLWPSRLVLSKIVIMSRL